MDRIEAPLWVSGAKGWKGELQRVSWASTLKSRNKTLAMRFMALLYPDRVLKVRRPLGRKSDSPCPRRIVLANRKRAERGLKAITMDALASEIGDAATTITRLARHDDKGESSLPLDLAGKILTVLEVGIGDLLEVVEQT